MRLSATITALAASALLTLGLAVDAQAAGTASPSPSPTPTSSSSTTPSQSSAGRTAGPAAATPSTATSSSTASTTPSASSSTTPSVSAQVATAISARYAALGGASGQLGAASGGVTCGLRGGGCAQNYANGAILWSPATGAHESLGAIRVRYSEMSFENGRLGYPTSGQVCGLAQGGCYQNFQGGAVLWSPATGAHENVGAIRDRYQQLGFENGRLGYPTSGEKCNQTGCSQNFQGGGIWWSLATGVRESVGAIGARFAQLGSESGRLGYPTSGEVCGIRDGGCYQNFQGGAILWSPATGAVESWGGTRARYAQLGFEGGRLGYPTSPEVCGIRDGGCYQNFQGGAILWSPNTGAFENAGAIRARYGQLGFENSRLGYPTSPEVCGIRDGGCYQNFQGGAIVWSPASGAFESVGSIRGLWAASGFEGGVHGYPTSGEYVANGIVYQDFQFGKAQWTASGGANWGVTNQHQEWMAAAGIAQSDWGYVELLIAKESGWNPSARNPNGACGLVQAFPCSKLGPNWSDPVVALRWGQQYVNERYGGWGPAWAHWQAWGSY